MHRNQKLREISNLLDAYNEAFPARRKEPRNIVGLGRKWTRDFNLSWQFPKSDNSTTIAVQLSDSPLGQLLPPYYL